MHPPVVSLLCRAVVLFAFLPNGSFSLKGIGEKCSETKECDDQVICANGYCMPSIPTERRCQVEVQCPAGESCRYGICWKVHYYSCSSNSNCPKPLVCRFRSCDVDNNTICSKHSECKDQQLCWHGKCKSASPSGGRCNDDSQCKLDEGCKHGICWGFQDDDTCEKHMDCKDQYLCFRGKCKEGLRTSIKCARDNDCPSRHGCKHGICWKLSSPSEKGCKMHSECLDMQLCAAGKCQNALPTKKSCTKNINCLFNEGCKHGICWKLTSPTKVCAKHEECEDQELCSYGQCKIAEPAGTTCEPNNSCPLHQACRHGICWKVVNENSNQLQCKDHSECDDNFLCAHFQCHQAEATTRTCKKDSQCRLNEGCRHQRCWYLQKRTENKCQLHQDCKGQRLCVRNVCKSAKFVSKLCMVNSECGLNGGCKFGICWTIA